MFCKNCGSRLESGTVFCPNCGARVEVNNNFNNNQFNNNARNNYSHNITNVDQNFINRISRPKTTFIFVTTLIIMIIFCIRFISIIGTFNNYEELKQYNDRYLNAVLSGLNIAIVFTVLSAVFSIIIFSIIANIRLKINNNQPYKNKVNGLIVISFINIFLYSIYAFSVFNLTAALQEFFRVYGGRSNMTPATIAGDVLACLSFITFAIINLVKAFKLKKHNFTT